MKKFTALFICLLMLITCGLTGCAGFSINKVKYYNEVLAEVGDTHITRYDLLTAYNSYGQSYYVQQQGKSEEEALASTLDLLIDREAMYQYASNAENNETFKPTPYQVNTVIEELFASLDSQMDTYIAESKNILNIKTEEVEEDEAASETAYKYSDYIVTNDSRRAFVVDETKQRTIYYTDSSKTEESETETQWSETKDYVVSKIVYNTKLIEEPQTYEKVLSDEYLNDHTADGIITAIQTKYFSKSSENKGLFYKHLEETEKENADIIYNKVMNLLTQDLLDYEHYLRDENGKEYSKNTNDLVYRYIERTFESNIQSQYLENIRTHYLKNAETELSINLLLDKFNKLYASSYNKYNNRESAYKDKMKDIGTDADSVLFHPELSDNTEFGYFVHTLISFNDSQKELYETREKLVTDEEKQDKFDEIMDLFNSDSSRGNLLYARNSEGEVDKSASVSIETIIEEYNAIKNNPAYNDEERLEAFVKEFMFKYTGDTATLSAGMPYAVGTNGYSSMMEEFTNECIKLMETDEVGAMSEIDLTNAESVCITSYGIHFVMYVGPVNTYDFPITDTSYAHISEFDKSVSDQFNLYTKVLNPLTGETYFDMLFNAVYPASGDAETFTSNNGYSVYEEGLIEDARKSVGVKEYKTKIEGTKTSL